VTIRPGVTVMLLILNILACIGALGAVESSEPIWFWGFALAPGTELPRFGELSLYLGERVPVYAQNPFGVRDAWTAFRTGLLRRTGRTVSQLVLDFGVEATYLGAANVLILDERLELSTFADARFRWRLAGGPSSPTRRISVYTGGRIRFRVTTATAVMVRIGYRWSTAPA